MFFFAEMSWVRKQAKTSSLPLVQIGQSFVSSLFLTLARIMGWLFIKNFTHCRKNETISYFIGTYICRYKFNINPSSDRLFYYRSGLPNSLSTLHMYLCTYTLMNHVTSTMYIIRWSAAFIVLLLKVGKPW